MDDVALLTEMLRIQSLSRHEGNLARFLVDEMSRRGFTARIDEAGNAIGEIGDARSGPTLLLLGHMDTVPGEVPVRREGNLLFGRGAVDAKGPLATFIAAATGHARVGRVIVVGAVEEEAATSKGARHIVHQYAPDCAIIGEPSAWDRITMGYKGRLLLHYRVEQGTAHTAGEQPSACETAVTFWQDVQREAAQFNAERPAAIFERLQPSLRAMHSGNDGLVDSADLELAFRLPPAFDAERWQATLTELAERGSLRMQSHTRPPGAYPYPAVDSGKPLGAVEATPDQTRLSEKELTAHVTLHYSAYEPAVRVEKNTALARAFLTAIRAEGGDPRFAVKTGTSDLNVVAQHWRCPMLAYGPGDARLDHTPDEHIDLTEYQRAIRVLRHTLASMHATGRAERVAVELR